MRAIHGGLLHLLYREDHMLLLQGGHIYNPEDMGVQDLLFANDRIVRIEPHISMPSHWSDLEVVNIAGKIVVPGFIDNHVHIAGGGGAGGPISRNADIQLSQITPSGVTTVVGVLGYDCTTKHATSVLARALALEEEGISAYMYVGGFVLPSPTITGSVTNDIAFIDKVVGVKLAISDPLCSQPSVEDIYHLAALARMGGVIGNKAGVLHVHVGRGKSGLQPLFDAVEHSDVPITQMVPTHVGSSTRNLDQAKAYAKAGGCVDVTATSAARLAERPPASSAVKSLLDAGVSAAQITISSDGNGNSVRRDDAGNIVDVSVAPISSLLETVQALVNEENVPLPTALGTVTSSPAHVLNLRQKGRIASGADADLVVLDSDLNVDRVYAKGQLMVKEGSPVVWGPFEAR